jgi:SAM-dependent methyltransferase
MLTPPNMVTSTPPLPFPAGQTEQRIKELFASVTIEDTSTPELENYWKQDWKRFVYTYGLVSHLNGSCLELGANPYYTSVLLKYFTPFEQTLANYFGPPFGATATQTVGAVNPHTGESEKHVATFHHFNIEDAQFPFPSDSFDVVLFCEILEHLQSDPIKVLREIKRVLKQGGKLILTTPNVARLENVCRLIAGANIYDPYSGYGPYGRHNREYNRDELAKILAYAGFEIEVLFSADVHENFAAHFAPLEQVTPLVNFRANDLGQYLFSRSSNDREAGLKRPSWLYRSYPATELTA